MIVECSMRVSIEAAPHYDTFFMVFDGRDNMTLLCACLITFQARCMVHQNIWHASIPVVSNTEHTGFRWDATTRDIYANFCPHDRADRWSPENGVFLYDPADRLFDRFLGSFYPITTPDIYLFHSFDPNMQTPIFVMTDIWLSVHQRQCQFVSNVGV